MLALAKLVERLLSVRYQGGRLLEDCFVALIEASLRLKEVQEEDEEEDENVEPEDEDDEDDSEDDSDEVRTSNFYFLYIVYLYGNDKLPVLIATCPVFLYTLMLLIPIVVSQDLHYAYDCICQPCQLND